MYSGGNREQVYALYLKYKAEMRRRGLYDKIDPVYHILNQLKKGFNGPSVHTCFVDEVQDLTQAELRLFFEVISS